MNTIELNKKQLQGLHPKPAESSLFSKLDFRKKYLEFALQQKGQEVYWYLKAIIIIPCVIMVPMIILMQISTPDYIWFVGLSMILFFTNVIVHIAQLSSSIYVPVYHLSVLIMILIPVLNFFLQL